MTGCEVWMRFSLLFLLPSCTLLCLVSQLLSHHIRLGSNLFHHNLCVLLPHTFTSFLPHTIFHYSLQIFLLQTLFDYSRHSFLPHTLFHYTHRFTSHLFSLQPSHFFFNPTPFSVIAFTPFLFIYFLTSHMKQKLPP